MHHPEALAGVAKATLFSVDAVDQGRDDLSLCAEWRSTEVEVAFR